MSLRDLRWLGGSCSGDAPLSSYIWKEELIEESELEVSLYTKESLMYEVVDIVKQRHSYDLPKITVIEPVYTLPEYEEWVKNSTT